MPSDKSIKLLSLINQMEAQESLNQYRKLQTQMQQSKYDELLKQQQQKDSVRNFRAENDKYAFGIASQSVPRQEMLGDLNNFLSEEQAPPEVYDHYQQLIEKNSSKPASETSMNYRGVPQYVGRTATGQGIVFNPIKASNGENPFDYVDIKEGQVKPRVDKDIPSEQITFLEQAQSLQNTVGEIDKMLGDPSWDWRDAVGPADARIGRVQDYFGVGADKNRVKLQSMVNDLQNKLIYLQSGKQINETEFERLMKVMPDYNTSEERFLAQMDNFKRTFSDILNNRKATLQQQPGYGNSVNSGSDVMPTEKPSNAEPKRIRLKVTRGADGNLIQVPSGE